MHADITTFKRWLQAQSLSTHWYGHNALWSAPGTEAWHAWPHWALALVSRLQGAPQPVGNAEALALLHEVEEAVGYVEH